MPPAEALATETLVVAANLPVFHEVLDAAGLYCDQFDVASIAAELDRARTLSPEARRKQIAMGLKRVAQFSWDASAEKLHDILKEKSRG